MGLVDGLIVGGAALIKFNNSVKKALSISQLDDKPNDREYFCENGRYYDRTAFMQALMDRPQADWASVYSSDDIYRDSNEEKKHPNTTKYNVQTWDVFRSYRDLIDLGVNPAEFKKLAKVADTYWHASDEKKEELIQEYNNLLQEREVLKAEFEEYKASLKNYSESLQLTQEINDLQITVNRLSMLKKEDRETKKKLALEIKEKEKRSKEIQKAVEEERYLVSAAKKELDTKLKLISDRLSYFEDLNSLFTKNYDDEYFKKILCFLRRQD